MDTSGAPEQYQPGQPRPDQAVKWGFSPADLRRHAVDEGRGQPRFALRAECGHLLIVSTVLSEEPCGSPCDTCAVIQVTRAITRARGTADPR